MTNAKNKLQEFCQKSDIAFPVYTDTQLETLEWISRVSVVYRDKSQAADGNVCRKKTTAQISAAGALLELLGIKISDNSSQVSTRINMKEMSKDVAHISSSDINTLIFNKCTAFGFPEGFTGQEEVCVLIDYENVNKLTYLHYYWKKYDHEAEHEPGHIELEGESVPILKFVGHCNQNANNTVSTHVLPCSGSDAIDHFISVFIGHHLKTWISTGKHHKVIIVSRDNFARLHSQFYIDLNLSIEFYHCGSEKSAVRKLKEFGCYKTNIVPKYIDDV